MPHVLSEIGLPNTKFSSLDFLSGDNRKASQDESKALSEDDAREEKVQEQSQERSSSNKENVSLLDYGGRDECHNYSDGDWSRFNSDPLPRVKSTSKEFFSAPATEEAALALTQLPTLLMPSRSCDQKSQDNRYPIVNVLQGLASSKVPDVNALQKILCSEDLVSSIREAYAHALVSSVYDVMLRHRTNREAQILGAKLLQKTAMYVPQAASEIGNGNGIQLLIHSMLLNKDCAAIQTAASAALAALCSTAQNRIIAGKFYVVEAIGSATQMFSEERYLQGACMKLLTAIASEAENIDIVASTKSIRLPFRVLRRHVRSTILVRIACECAHQLLQAFDETDLEEVAQMNPMKHFLLAISEHADDERTQIAAIECATVLCRVDRTCFVTCINGRAAELCVRNLRRFRGRDHGRLYLACMEILCVFAEAGCQKIIVSAGALEGCLTCMIEMKTVFEIQLCGLRLLELVVETGVDSFLQRIIIAGGVEVLSTSLKTYILREGFVERGVRVMRSLRG